MRYHRTHPSGRTPPKQTRIVLVSEIIQERAAALLGEIIRAPPEQLMRQVTLLPGTAEPKYANKRRQGRPKNSWIELTMRRAWKDYECWLHLEHEQEPEQVPEQDPERDRTFDINNTVHLECIYNLGMYEFI